MPFSLENGQNYVIIEHLTDVVGQFGLKRCQTKREVMTYKILKDFFYRIDSSKEEVSTYKV